MNRRALITGIAGQDGSYLAELLLEQGYQVFGLVRGETDRPLPNIEAVRDRLTLIAGDVRDRDSVLGALELASPDEVYHLAGPTFVPELWADPPEALSAIAGATGMLLQAIVECCPESRVMVASSREIFGLADESPQRETSRCRPTNPYGIAKLAAHQLCGALRDHWGIHVCSAILYNHESPRRPEHFVTRKVTRAAAAIKLGVQDELVIGDLEVVRDWCFAGDAMRAAWLMVQHERPDDYVVASGQGRSVGDLVRCAFSCAGIDPHGRVRVDDELVRGYESTAPVGDPAKARSELGWRPEVSFESMIDGMVQADLRSLAGGDPGGSLKLED